MISFYVTGSPLAPRGLIRFTSLEPDLIPCAIFDPFLKVWEPNDSVCRMVLDGDTALTEIASDAVAATMAALVALT